MKPRKISLPVLLIITLCGLSSVYCLGSIIQLNYFFLKEREAAPKFDDLNQAILDELPPPNGIIEIKKNTVGTSVTPSNHGRWLSIYYSMDKLNEEQIFSYYTNLLTSKGWQFIDNPAMNNYGTYRYVHGSACVGLDIFPKMTPAPQYSISIWQDFWSQPFSPPKPNITLLNILDLEVTVFSRCTPSIQY